jgi:hypothetical protein
MKSASSANDPGKTRISVQYRTKQGKVYEITRGLDVLALCISPPELDSDKWHVEARLGSGPGATDALSATALAWTTQTPRLTVFDWDAVTRELKVVQAV